VAAVADDVLETGDRVVMTHDLREVPEGTEGTVVLVVGITWFRYWVRFDNGVAVGSVNRKHLATPDEWKAIQAGGGPGAESSGAEEAEAEAGGGGSDGGGYTHNGVLVPQLLLDRTKAARERLGV